MSTREAGVYVTPPGKHDTCNFIHKDGLAFYDKPATAVLEFQLNSGQYTQVLRVCDEHLAQIHEVTAS